MNDKEQRAVWLAQLKEYQKQLDTGRGVIFGRGFTKAHDSLVEEVGKVCLILEGYMEQESLSVEQSEQLKKQLDDLNKSAGEYIKAKETDDKYSLDGSEDGSIKKAKGDKRKRLEAASGLMTLSSEMSDRTAEKIELAKLEEEAKKAMAGNVPGIEKDRRRARSLKELGLMEQEDRAVRDVQAGVIASKLNTNAMKESFKRSLVNHEYKKESYEDLKEGYVLHRGDILNFNTDEGFKAGYDKYRMKIFKSVESYRKLEEMRRTNRAAFEEALGKMHLTEKTFNGMSDKINVIEMEGEYLDVRADIVSNPEYITMSEDARKALRSMSIEELEAGIQEFEGDESKADRKKLLEDMKTLKGMAEYGVKENYESTLNRKDTVLDNAGGKHTTTTLAFNTRYEDHGGFSIKKKGVGKSLKDMYDSHNFSFKASDATAAYNNGVFENADFLNVSTGVFKGKYRIAKLGGKARTTGGALQGGAHVSLGTVKTAGSVGAAFSASKLWETKAYATVSANAYGLRGVAKGSVGWNKDWVKFDAKTEGTIGSAVGIAQGGVGMIRYKDDKGKDHEGFGVAADLTAAAAVFEGSVSGGLTVFGIRFGGKVSGAAIAAGVKTRFAATHNVLNFGLSAALGLGVGFEISIDITGLKEKFKNWRNRGKQEKKLREKKAQERADKLDIEKEYEIIEKPDADKKDKKDSKSAGPAKNK